MSKSGCCSVLGLCVKSSTSSSEVEGWVRMIRGICHIIESEGWGIKEGRQENHAKECAAYRLRVKRYISSTFFYFSFLTVRLSEKRLLTPIVCFPSCKESFFSLDKTRFVSFGHSGWDTKRRTTMCENRAWYMVKNGHFSANYPQCHCHCRQLPQCSWTNKPLCSPSMLLWPPGLSGLTAVALSRPGCPGVHRGLAPLEVETCLWELSSWCSFLHSWGHWLPRGGSPHACPGHWPGRREERTVTSDMWCRWNYGSTGRRSGSCMCSLKIACLFCVKLILHRKSWPSSLGLLLCPWLKKIISPNGAAQSIGDRDDSQRASGSDEWMCSLYVHLCVSVCTNRM